MAILAAAGSLTPLQAHAATVTSASSKSTQTTTTITGSGYTPLSPVRILDTRKGIGAPAAKVPAFGTVSLKVVGTAGVPSGVIAVALNITVVNPTQTGYITAYPGGQAKPGISNLNFKPGQIVPNTAIVQVGTNGYVNFANGSGGTVDLLADLAGYYSPTSPDEYWGLYPGRLLDTRGGNGTLPPNGVAKVKVVEAVATNLNITVTNPQQSGYIAAYPDGVAAPTTSNVNFTAGQTVANGATVEIGVNGYVDFVNRSAGSVDLIVDGSGRFVVANGPSDILTRYYPITPTRVIDTRAATPLGPQGAVNGVLGGHVSIAANFTVTNPTAGGYLEVYPADEEANPGISLLNFSANQTVANAGAFTDEPGLDIWNASVGSTDVIVDEFGYYTIN
jgi:hypothetical protein